VTGTVITCVSDDENFARQVYDYLLSGLERQKQFKEGKDLRVSQELVRLAGDEIHVDQDTLAPGGMIKWILESFLRSDPAKFNEYGVVEFGDSFTIGRILHPSKMEMSTCEICGFFTPHSEELYTHRMTHFGL
jgi:hypothetical protein